MVEMGRFFYLTEQNLTGVGGQARFKPGWPDITIAVFGCDVQAGDLNMKEDRDPGGSKVF